MYIEQNRKVVLYMAYEIRIHSGGKKPLQTINSENLPRVGDTLRVFNNVCPMKDCDRFDSLHTDYSVIDVFRMIGRNSNLTDVVIVKEVPQECKYSFA